MKNKASFIIPLVLAVGCTISLREKGLTEELDTIPDMETTLRKIVPVGTTLNQTRQLMKEHGFECLDFIRVLNADDADKKVNLDCIRYDSLKRKGEDYSIANRIRVWFVSFPVHNKQVGEVRVSKYYK